MDSDTFMENFPVKLIGRLSGYLIYHETIKQKYLKEQTSSSK